MLANGKPSFPFQTESIHLIEPHSALTQPALIRARNLFRIACPKVRSRLPKRKCISRQAKWRIVGHAESSTCEEHYFEIFGQAGLPGVPLPLPNKILML
jgi:hypothetical protein